MGGVLRGDELPAPFVSTTIERLAPPARPHSFEKSVHPGSFAVRLIAQVFFHGWLSRHYTDRPRTNQGEIA